MPVDILQPFEREARERFEKEYKEYRKKYGLPELHEIESKLRVSFPTLKKSTNIDVPTALLAMLRSAYDTMLIGFLSRILFPSNPLEAIESPFKEKEERENAMRKFKEILLIFWDLVSLTFEKDEEKKIKKFLEYYEKYQEYESFLIETIEKIKEKIRKDLEKREEKQESIFR